jgi:hypothetical protein
LFLLGEGRGYGSHCSVEAGPSQDVSNGVASDAVSLSQLVSRRRSSIIFDDLADNTAIKVRPTWGEWLSNAGERLAGVHAQDSDRLDVTSSV